MDTDDIKGRLATIEAQLQAVQANMAEAKAQHSALGKTQMELMTIVSELRVIVQDNGKHAEEARQMLLKVQDALIPDGKDKANDHERRISALERARAWIVGLGAGLGFVLSKFTERLFQ